MSFYSAKKKIKNIAAFLIILIFLPYVVSIFVNGKDVNLQNGSGHFTIKVARTDPDGTELDLVDAALRSAYYFITGKNPDPDVFHDVRGIDGHKEATFTIPGAGDVRVAVVSGLGNARRLMQDIDAGRAQYDFVDSIRQSKPAHPPDPDYVPEYSR